MKLKATILDENALRRAMTRIAHEIVECNADAAENGNLCLVGILRRGAPLAVMLQGTIEALLGKNLPLGTLDITLYRDDLSREHPEPKLNRTDIAFSVEGKTVVMVDDVLYTGRTARSAMDAIISLGRPAKIQLAVLIDRGHREFPIRADYVGKNTPTSRHETVSVCLPPYDRDIAVRLYDGALPNG